MSRIIKFIMLALLSVVVIGTPAMAMRDSSETANAIREPRTEDATETETETEVKDSETTAEQAREAVREKKAEIKARVAAKLDATKLKVCQNRSDSIKRITSNIQERAARQIEVFNKIAERTMKFYEDKNLSVTNYADLTQTVSDKKLAAEQVVKDVTAFSSAFACSSDNASSYKDDVKTQLKLQNAALKDYKTSVKDLIVAVKSAQRQSDATETEMSEGGQQ